MCSNSELRNLEEEEGYVEEGECSGVEQ